MRLVLMIPQEFFSLSFCQSKRPPNTQNRTGYNSVALTTIEKRGIWLLLVRDSRPTTAKQVNEQSDTHAVGIYSTPQKVCVMAWLAIGTPTGTVYTYPQHQPLLCP